MTDNHTVLAFDFGTKNIGVAIGQSSLSTAQPLPPIPAKEGIPNWDQIQKLAEDWKATKVIVGLPLNMDGSEQEMTRRARKFGNRIHARVKLTVEFVDERLSTREAKELAFEGGHKGNFKQSPIDSIAAQVLLESYWRSHS